MHVSKIFQKPFNINCNKENQTEWKPWRCKTAETETQLVFCSSWNSGEIPLFMRDLKFYEKHRNAGEIKEIALQESPRSSVSQRDKPPRDEGLECESVDPNVQTVQEEPRVCSHKPSRSWGRIPYIRGGGGGCIEGLEWFLRCIDGGNGSFIASVVKEIYSERKWPPWGSGRHTGTYF